MRKNVLLGLFMITCLMKCGPLNNPMEPEDTYTVYVDVKDIYQKNNVKRLDAHINSNLAKVGEDGVLICSFKTNSKKDFYLSIFPYEPLKLPLNSFQDSKKPSTAFLRFPPKLEEYYSIIQRAKDLGYTVTSIEDWHKNQEKYKDKKLFIMRHDVDFDFINAKAFAYIEDMLEVTSTYYWRWCTADKDAIEYVKSCGHEVGLHYETLATFCTDNKLSRGEDVTPDVIKECRDILKFEIRTFEELFGDTYSISSHGEAKNREIGIPNRILVDGQDLAEYGVAVCGSQIETTRRFHQTFVADSGGKWYPFDVDHAMDLAPQNIYCLIHPYWWRNRH